MPAEPRPTGYLPEEAGSASAARRVSIRLSCRRRRYLQSYLARRKVYPGTGKRIVPVQKRAELRSETGIIRKQEGLSYKTPVNVPVERITETDMATAGLALSAGYGISVIMGQELSVLPDWWNWMSYSKMCSPVRKYHMDPTCFWLPRPVLTERRA